MQNNYYTGSVRPRVLITRPRAQAKSFAQLCTHIGFEVTLLPCLEIVPLPIQRHSLSARLGDDQTVLFTSANAVHQAHVLQPLPWSHQKIHAIGAATARALTLYEQQVEFAPRAPYNSEAYLEQIQHSAPESLLILKGCGGRDHIQNTLNARGCKISSLDLYYRRLPQIADELVEESLLHNPPDVISVTSNAALNNLCIIAKAHLHSVKSLPLIVNSSRCAEQAVNKGFTHPARVANPAGDQGQAECLLQWLNDWQRYQHW